MAKNGEARMLGELEKESGHGTGAYMEPLILQCPRCDSLDTKFSYYNNYKISQPRHLCKKCQRYWTEGGSLRYVPVGAALRKASAFRRRRQPYPSNTTTTTTRYSRYGKAENKQNNSEKCSNGDGDDHEIGNHPILHANSTATISGQVTIHP